MGKGSKGNQNLTEGSIVKKLLLFSLPFLGSSLIQQMYNTVDLMFVGNLLGKESAAAVGAGSLLVNCMLGLFTGMSVGVSVVIGKAFGAGNKKAMHDTLHTAAGITVTGGILLTILGWILCPALLGLLSTPDNIMELAVTYLRIYFLSILSMVTYNISSGVLRALGNSRSPMIYQFFGGVANVLGNTLFIYLLDMGVAGVAYATLLSQTVAAMLTLRHLCQLDEEYRLHFSKIRLRFSIVKQIFAIGLPAGIQSMIITFSNLIVQSRINSLGVVTIASFATYFRVESFIYLPILAIGQSITAFTSQNMGAGRYDRVKKGVKVALLTGITIVILDSSLCLYIRDALFGLFSNDPQVIALGGSIAAVTFPLYFLYVFLEALSGTIRGAGKALPPMIIILVNMCLVRILVLTIIMKVNPTASGVAWMYPITWLTTAICLSGYYLSGKWMPKAGDR